MPILKRSNVLIAIINSHNLNLCDLWAFDERALGLSDFVRRALLSSDSVTAAIHTIAQDSFDTEMAGIERGLEPGRRFLVGALRERGHECRTHPRFRRCRRSPPQFSEPRLNQGFINRVRIRVPPVG